jgi:hypothetical protein
MDMSVYYFNKAFPLKSNYLSQLDRNKWITQGLKVSSKICDFKYTEGKNLSHKGKTEDSINNYQGKDKVHPRTDHEGPEGEYRYNSTLSLTSVLDGDG